MAKFYPALDDNLKAFIARQHIFFVATATQDGRMTLMFCAFEGDHLILRLYGQGRAIKPGDPEWATLAPKFPTLPGTRQIILLDIESLQTSCGAGVPLYAYTGEREALPRWLEKKGEQGVRDYQHEKNQVSIDGLPTGLFEEKTS